ncbi:hypothetical protein [Streptomyces sp. NPDC056401]|uniref:hypothetical protein n=1 Tax=Streptomyces sp. NPDC056401 TaxID=3345809 RepID=UPI0035DAEF0D
MKETFGSDFKQYYNGDPEKIPEANMPCLVVEMLSDRTELGQTNEDDVVEQIRVKAIFNKKDDFSNDADPINVTHKRLRAVIGARDEDTGEYLKKTIKGALRQKMSAGNLIVSHDMTVDLGIQFREGEVVTAEGHVTVAVGYSVNIVEE